MSASSNGSAQVLDVLRDLYAQQNVEAFVARVVVSLPRLIATDMTSFNEVDPATGRTNTVVAPAGADRFPGSEEVFERHVREHPYVVHVRRFQDGQAHRLSEFIGRAAFRRLAIYNEYYRHIGTEHQVAIALPWAAPGVRGIALSRGTRDYSDRERRLLTILGPHMIQAYRTAEALENAHRIAGAAKAAATGTAADNGVEVVLLSGRRGVQFATPRARRWFASYFGGSSTRDSRLPSALAEWVGVQAMAIDGRDAVPPLRRPLIVARTDARLEVRLAANRGQQALLLRERRRDVPPGAFAALGLSPREAEVLTWVVAGKTNDEIGTIIAARPRTIAKHLERIFRKLGVETRTAAAVSAMNHRPE